MHIMRPMHLGDIDEVHRIEVSGFSAAWRKSTLREFVTEGYDCRVLEKIDVRGKLIEGFIIGSCRDRDYNIINLCVDSTQKKKGLGKFIIKTVLASLKSVADSVDLEVRVSNIAAIKLYESFGFQHVKIIKHYYQDKNGKEDGLVLRKVL